MSVRSTVRVILRPIMSSLPFIGGVEGHFPYDDIGSFVSVIVNLVIPSLVIVVKFTSF